MANYNNEQLKGKGTPIESLIAGTTYTFTITKPSSFVGSSYMVFETKRNIDGFYDSTSLKAANGDLSNQIGLQVLSYSPYIFAANISKGGGSFTFTPSNNIPEGEVFLRLTGEGSINIS